MSLEATAKAEVLEECGYEIPLDNLGMGIVRVGYPAGRITGYPTKQ